MPESKPPLISRLWSIVWLVIFGVIAIWLLSQVLAAVWGWLLLAAGLIGAVVVTCFWIRSRRDRW
ncbi:hypothetical protein [Herbiconiux daphne]|uniref:DUF4175 domain-containing protein n=1 Tax=Herbiconiux daphne TaxID=2970914 RepID=A0ABT2H538_9MICO|nr:hypothetical protein [Herbiconiux daphne]MCS5735054.1 hypothetical protein [Herbiconiux daphne]